MPDPTIPKLYVMKEKNLVADVVVKRNVEDCLSVELMITFNISIIWIFSS